MHIELPPDVYGDRTSVIADIITVGENIPFLREPDTSMTSVACDGGTPTWRSRGMTNVQLVSGPAVTLCSLWPTGENWRRSVQRSIADLRMRHRERGPALLGPPIWPAGASNVFGITVFATEKQWKRCQLLGASPADIDTLWMVACFIEKVVDASLESALFGDELLETELRPLLALLACGIIPIDVTLEQCAGFVYRE